MFLCGHVADAGDGNVHLAWVFDAIRPDAYPHTQKVICVTVQLTDGIGDVPVSVKVVQLAEDEEPKTIVNSQPVWFSFPKRLTVHRAILRLTNGVFPKAGLYLIEVDCGDDCVGDAPLRLFPAEEEV